jgi:hypothetical protein
LEAPIQVVVADVVQGDRSRRESEREFDEELKQSERVFTKHVLSKVTIKLPSPYLPLHESQSETSSTAGNGGVGKRKVNGK